MGEKYFKKVCINKEHRNKTQKFIHLQNYKNNYHLFTNHEICTSFPFGVSTNTFRQRELRLSLEIVALRDHSEPLFIILQFDIIHIFDAIYRIHLNKSFAIRESFSRHNPLVKMPWIPPKVVKLPRKSSVKVDNGGSKRTGRKQQNDRSSPIES